MFCLVILLPFLIVSLTFKRRRHYTETVGPDITSSIVFKSRCNLRFLVWWLLSIACHTISDVTWHLVALSKRWARFCGTRASSIILSFLAMNPFHFLNPTETRTNHEWPSPSRWCHDAAYIRFKVQFKALVVDACTRTYPHSVGWAR